MATGQQRDSTAAPVARVFRGEREVEAIDAADRGLAYGDGVFETLRAHRGDAPWWDAHWARLRRGARALGLPVPEEAQVRDVACALLRGEDAVLKVLLTRGVGGRGYAPPHAAVPTWVVSRHPLPPAPPEAGLRVRWCHTRLAIQPGLAGLKHCNRLEQVLARAEAGMPGTDAPSSDERPSDEGLMLSTAGDVISATSANLFVLRDGQWWTPPVTGCGVAGICRAWVLAHAPAGEAVMAPRDVEAADAVFLCNAVRGILPVARLATRCWARHPRLEALRAQFAADVPAFALETP